MTELIQEQEKFFYSNIDKGIDPEMLLESYRIFYLTIIVSFCVNVIKDLDEASRMICDIFDETKNNALDMIKDLEDQNKTENLKH